MMHLTALVRANSSSSSSSSERSPCKLKPAPRSDSDNSAAVPGPDPRAHSPARNNTRKRRKSPEQSKGRKRRRTPEHEKTTDAFTRPSRRASARCRGRVLVVECGVCSCYAEPQEHQRAEAAKGLGQDRGGAVPAGTALSCKDDRGQWCLARTMSYNSKDWDVPCVHVSYDGWPGAQHNDWVEITNTKRLLFDNGVHARTCCQCAHGGRVAPNDPPAAQPSLPSLPHLPPAQIATYFARIAAPSLPAGDVTQLDPVPKGCVVRGATGAVDPSSASPTETPALTAAFIHTHVCPTPPAQHIEFFPIFGKVPPGSPVTAPTLAEVAHRLQTRTKTATQTDPCSPETCGAAEVGVGERLHSRAALCGVGPGGINAPGATVVGSSSGGFGAASAAAAGSLHVLPRKGERKAKLQLHERKGTTFYKFLQYTTRNARGNPATPRQRSPASSGRRRSNMWNFGGGAIKKEACTYALPT